MNDAVTGALSTDMVVDVVDAEEAEVLVDETAVELTTDKDTDTVDGRKGWASTFRTG